MHTLEYAKQGDNDDHTADFSSAYIFVEPGYESLGSDSGNVAFQTPQATKHAFNGWADKFLATPDTGLNDAYVKVAAKAAGMKFIAVYHDYSADEDNADYGTELDLLAVKKFNKTFTDLIKYTDYSADTFSDDTSKLWIQLAMNL